MASETMLPGHRRLSWLQMSTAAEQAREKEYHVQQQPRLCSAAFYWEYISAM